jgi:hypothetical protein
MLLISFQHGLKRWWTCTTNESGSRWMLERSFQEGCQNEVEKKEVRWRMLQKGRQGRWWNKRMKGRVYTNEDLWRCQIWFSNIFDLRWRWQLTIEQWMSFAIKQLWRGQLQRPNHVFYMIFSSCHLSALISSRLLVKIRTKKNCWYPPASKASLIHFVLWYLCLGWKCHWVSMESILDFVRLLVWLSLCY